MSTTHGRLFPRERFRSSHEIGSDSFEHRPVIVGGATKDAELGAKRHGIDKKVIPSDTERSIAGQKRP
jgi:hypothetical protein